MSGTSARRRPVELQVLAGSEVSVAAVVAARDRGELGQLSRGEQAIGDGDAQHGRVPLQVQAVAQAQRPELILGELPRKVAPRLVAELRDALFDKRLVELVVLVHASRL